jgi:hypothetical protein
MREPDRDKFQEAIKKECEDHFRESNYKLINIDEVHIYKYKYKYKRR